MIRDRSHKQDINTPSNSTPYAQVGTNQTLRPDVESKGGSRRQDAHTAGRQPVDGDLGSGVSWREGSKEKDYEIDRSAKDGIKFGESCSALFE